MYDWHVQIHLRQFDNTKYSAQDVDQSKRNTGEMKTAETCLDEAPAATATAGSAVSC